MSRSQVLFRPMLTPFVRLLLLAGALLVSAAGQASAVEPLTFTKEQRQATVEVVKQLGDRHYRSLSFDDELSSRYLDNYLRGLDPTRSFLLGTDIEHFNQHRTRFDDYLKRGDLKASYEIFNRFRERSIARLEWVLERLEDDETEYDFDADDYLIIDWEKAEWPANAEAADSHWYKRLKSDLLNLQLAGRGLDDAREVLVRRYQSQLRRINQQTADDAFERMINALATLYDPHTSYMTPSTMENFNINMSLSLEGIGAVLQSEDEYTKVLRVVPSGPADRQGDLRPADRIVAIGQGAEGEMVDVVGWRLDEVVQKIRGPKDTLVRLEVLPANASPGSPTRTFSIKRETVKLEDQAAKSAVFELGSGEDVYRLGVINIPTFYMDFEAYRNRDPNYKSTTRDVYRLLGELDEKGVDGVIIDLRNNGGGSLQEATTLTDLFIDQGPVVQIRHSNEQISRNFRSHSRAAYRGPVVVLINRLSASASEIFAGALQDYGRGVIVGTQSFGKGSVQSMIPLDEGQLKITESKFYRISGESTQHRGVVPDIAFPSMVSLEDVGESAYDHALPWDKIHAVPHARYFDINRVLPEMQQAHEQRAARDPDFTYLVGQAGLMEENRNRERISLRKATRQAEQEAIEARSLALENIRRQAKGLEPLENFADLDDEDVEGESPLAAGRHSQEIDPDGDALLFEAGNILLDFIRELERQDNARLANF
ncbi:carboxy terminal-processing peptidase [Marinimicrobium alkaliphilum]|uniref:carboxy terminal-processing peptidase n=1 Tax=Marinimicrobium alkaliphilum TaxID=2202654 RepID=UPI001E404681|nr:carboxy terminal-processing peptidase [Marinimicrobium alkaliphilum]